MFPQIVAIVFLGAAILQLTYAVFLFLPSFSSYWNRKGSGTAINKSEIPEYAQLPVSVIICAHNEEQALRTNLERILQQNYHNQEGQAFYEVIVVNDRSDDATTSVLEDLRRQYAILRIVDILPNEPRTFPGKKFALSRGVAAAKYKHIIMTDADCHPASSSWISWMTYPFTMGKEIVAGFGAYNKGRGYLNKFIRCETIHTFVQLLSYNTAGLPYMAVGRNLAVKKSLLIKVQSHPLYSATTSGDDDMLVRVCATRANMTVNVHPASFTYSGSKASLNEYIHQKQRHTSTGKYYRKSVQYLLGGYALSHAIFWLCTILLLVSMPGYLFSRTSNLYCIVTIAWLLRIALMWYIFIAYIGKLTRDLSLKIFWPIFDVGWAIYNLILSPYILWKNKQEWK